MLAQLRVLQGPMRGKMILLLEGRKISLGRSEKNTLTLPDEDLSRRHCIFESEGLCWTLTDLNSHNGTFVNGQKITSVTLREGDRVRLGDSEFEFHVERNLEGAYGLGTDAFKKESTLLLGEEKCARCGGTAYVPDAPSQNPLRRRARTLLCRRCADPLLGKVIAGYTLVDKVSDDRRVPVYRAGKGDDPRAYAFKVLRKADAPSEEFVSRFLREAEWKERLDHPNIAAIHDAGETEELYFLAMEFVEGDTLEHLVARSGPMPPEQARSVALQVAAALEYLHSIRVVHRDVKPSNIMIGVEGRAKLIDMGSAKCYRDQAATDITRAGVGLGTLQFMSPEQAFDARSVDHRADIYSLGATFYFILVGTFPYKVRSVVDVVAKSHGDTWVSPRTHRPEVPEAYDAVIQKMMRGDPEDRYQEPAELHRALLALGHKG
ncbi:MAG: protein kinase [Planctomycetes bacterium]|nr:protein kinase [Planctomycetota bacterium]